MKEAKKADDEWEYIKVKNGKNIIMKKFNGKLVKVGEEITAPKKKFW